ncbi:MAG: type III-B CRISPR module-associated Cmr3 family protein [Victivallales bacterium]
MSKEHKFHIEPRDLVFMRDARPMEASDAGLGANWPRPDQIWNAFINAFHSKWPKPEPWEGPLHDYKPGVDDNSDSSFRFGALKSAGPFPVDEIKKEIYFPCPLDLSSDDEGSLHPMKLTCASGSNIPKPLRYAFSSSKLGKNEAPPWISSKDYSEYLKGNPFKPEKVDLYDVERNIGIGIDPATNSTIDGKLYQAEYLRLRHSTRMAVQVSCCLKGDTDVFEKIATEKNIPFVLGGQQGVALLNSPSHTFSLPYSVIPSSVSGKPLLRWTLLSPAVFPEISANSAKGVKPHPGGWLPNWVDPKNGQVMLPRKNIDRNGENRDAWRKRVKESERFSAKLVAARIGKPLALSGWDLQTGPKPTQIAVPAGSCYVFECANIEEAKDLRNALSWNGGDGDSVKNRRSTIFGEKGFGLGVCSSYTIKNTNGDTK